MLPSFDLGMFLELALFAVRSGLHGTLDCPTSPGSFGGALAASFAHLPLPANVASFAAAWLFGPVPPTSRKAASARSIASRCCSSSRMTLLRSVIPLPVDDYDLRIALLRTYAIMRPSGPNSDHPRARFVSCSGEAVSFTRPADALACDTCQRLEEEVQSCVCCNAWIFRSFIARITSCWCSST